MSAGAGEAGAAVGAYGAADVVAATVMLAAVFASLDLPAGATIVLHVEPSDEAVLVDRAARSAGLGVVSVSVGAERDRDSLARVLAQEAPALLVCRPADFTWASKLAFGAGVSFVFSLGRARDGSLLERAVALDRVLHPAA